MCQKTDDSNWEEKKKVALKTTSKTFPGRAKKEHGEQKAKKNRGRGRLLDTSLNRPYLQICICLCSGSDFTADRYCLPGAREMMWTEFNRTRRQLHSGNRSSRDSSKMFSLPILLHRMNICRVLLSINTLIIEDTFILLQELNVMTTADKNLNLTVSVCISDLVGDLHTRFWHLCVIPVPALLKLLSIC